MTYVVGLDVGHRTIVAAERWLLSLLTTLDRDPARIACTHVMARPTQHVAVTWTAPRSAPWTAHVAPVRSGARGVLPTLVAGGLHDAAVTTATGAAREHAERRAGRAVIYPGCARMTGVMRVEDVMQLSAIERVIMFDGSSPCGVRPRADTKLDTRDHVRPQWSGGTLTLLVRPSASGHVVPFERPSPG